MIVSTKLDDDIGCAIFPMRDVTDLGSEFCEPGLYMLMGREGENLTPAYVGVSRTNVSSRIRNHRHELWDKAMIFNFPRYNETSVNLKSLEHCLITLVDYGDAFFSLNQRFSDESMNEQSKIAMQTILFFMGLIGMDLLNPKPIRSKFIYNIRKLNELTRSQSGNTLVYGTSWLKYTLTKENKILARRGSICSHIYSEDFKNLASESQTKKRDFYLKAGMIEQHKNQYKLTNDMLFTSFSRAMEVLTLDQFDTDKRWESYGWGASRTGSSPFKYGKNMTSTFLFQVCPELQFYFEEKIDYNFSGFHRLNDLEKQVIIKRGLK